MNANVVVLMGVLAAGLSACASSAPPTEDSSTSGPPEAAARVSVSPPATFWDLAPLGDGDHLKVQIEDRARAADCVALNVFFDRIAGDDVDGFTVPALTYIDEHRVAAGCDGTESADTSPSPSPSASPSLTPATT